LLFIVTGSIEANSFRSPRLSVTSASFSFNVFGNRRAIVKYCQNRLPTARSSFAQGTRF
jgi:hypothetical protein